MSKKSKRVVGSIMGGEVNAFVDSFDKLYILKRDLERLLNCKLSLHMTTDPKRLFNVMTKGQQPTEKRLIIDISAARETYKLQEISQVGLVRSMRLVSY